MCVAMRDEHAEHAEHAEQTRCATETKHGRERRAKTRSRGRRGTAVN
jgi:hypothetical protein